MKSKTYQEKQEFWNIITHATGIVLAIVGTGVLLIKSFDTKTSFASTAAIVYGASMIMLYTASTIYHLHWNHKNASKYRIFDHISIYFLIAGTYTPFTLLILFESSGLWMLITIWSITLAGTIYKLFFTGKFKYFSTIIYLAMSWLMVFDFSSLMSLLSKASFAWLLTGGVFYTAGAVVYSVKKIPYNHAIWHVFVLGGTVSHYISILYIYS